MLSVSLCSADKTKGLRKLQNPFVDREKPNP